MDHRQANRRLWNEWSEKFQALWNANTATDPPPAPSPFDPDKPGGHPEWFDGVAGKSFVELGCGGGQGSVGTAELGADRVVGVDFSGEQLGHAKHLRDFYGVEASFVQADVTNLPLPADSFDLAGSEAAFQLVPDIDAALTEARRVLRDGAVFVLSLPHPMYEITDDETGEIEGNYFDTDARTLTIDEEYNAELVSFDRPIADLHGALTDAGFAVRRLLEHKRPRVRMADREDSEVPELCWRIPQSVRFWAVAV